MPKTISSAGLQNFIETGTPTKIYPKEAKTAPKEAAAPALEVVKPPEAAKPPEEGKAPPPEKPKEAAVEAPKEEGLEAEDAELPERARRRIGFKHAKMKEAQEQAQEAERFAETQFNERRLLEQRLAQTEAERDALKKTAEPAAALTKPDPQTFLDEKGQFKALEYAEALATYSAKKAVEEERQTQAETAAKAAAQLAQEAFRARIEAAVKLHPDWHEVVKSTPIVLPTAALNYMAESDHGAELAYFLALPENKDSAERLKGMSPARAVAELGRLEIRFEKPAVKPNGAPALAAAPAAPAPITPLPSGSVQVTSDPAKMSFKELRAYERERARRH